jgi:integral membrane protein (TIGR01906 family)|tara:strand:+ start:3022 stop:3660 length:639 start_codon:yes stop_codon:yes gene_type:complete
MFRRILLFIFLPLTLLLINAQFLVLNQSFYEKEFIKHDVYIHFEELSKEEIDSEVTSTILFLKGKGELSSDFFNNKEKQHLHDVRSLLKDYKVSTFILIGITLFLIFLTRKDRNAFVYACMVTIGVLLLILFLVSINFSTIFTKFHEVSFPNDLWLLNPEKDNLINLFPQAFFYDTFFLIGRNTLLSALLLLIIIRIKQKIYKNKRITKNYE